MEESRFVAFDTSGLHDNDLLVNDLLRRSIVYMNEKVSYDPSSYHKLNGSEVEKLSYNSMVEVAPSVSFDKDRIKLISGHIFPDIILKETSYGVEIKSTQQDAWTSTGSSIMERTHAKGVERVYMLFGKLGGNPEFRCKPYQCCLSDIAVTHSPRYLINMNVSKEDNIFSKMHTDYDHFRKLKDKEKGSIYTHYYIDKAKKEGKQEMPWWIDGVTSPTLSFYNDLSTVEKEKLLNRAYILFGCLYGRDRNSRFKQVALWLCVRHSLLCYNMRDAFTAGGRANSIHGNVLERSYPHIVLELLERRNAIKKILDDPDEDLVSEIDAYWDFQYDSNNLFNSWVNMVGECSKNNPEFKDVPIKNLLKSEIE